MVYVTSLERILREEARQEGFEEGLLSLVEPRGHLESAPAALGRTRAGSAGQFAGS